jgi:hypothetical protein
MTETMREVVDSWDLPNGDRVQIVRATIKRTDATGGIKWSRRFHYSVIAANGEKVGTSGETFTRRRSATRAAERHHPRPVEPEAVAE